MWAPSTSEGRDHGLDLRVRVDLLFSRLLNVQDLAAQRQDGLCLTVPGILGAAAGGIALHDEDLASAGIFGGAVGEFSGQAEVIQRVRPAHVVAGLPRVFTGLLRQQGLIDNGLGNLRILLQEVDQLIAHDGFHRGTGFGVAQLLLGLAFKLRIFDLDGDDGCQAFADIIAGQVLGVVLQDLILAGIVVKALGRGVFKAGQMHAALRRNDVIDEA